MLKRGNCIGSGFCLLGPSRCAHKLKEFWRKLQELGYSEGKNLISEIREARGDVDRLPELASEIVDTHPDVIVAVTSPASVAAKMATQTIPIVMAIVSDPIGLGLVESLPRPGTNITGSSSLGNRDYSQASATDQRDAARAVDTGHALERKGSEQSFNVSVG
jgi:ABC transporter substrate binding protein